MLDSYDNLTARLRASGDYIWPLALRAILAWEFWEAGIGKLRGSNWFADIPWADWQQGFPWPFSVMPVEVNWFAATWAEIVFSLMLLFGLFTRFAALSLLVVTAVATAAVHWPREWENLPDLWEGYVITAEDSGNFKLPLLFMIMLLPLLFYGGGRLSLDYLLLKINGRHLSADDRLGDSLALASGFLVLAIATIYLVPAWGYGLLALAIISATLPRWFR